MIVFRALQGFWGGSMIPTVFTTAFAFFPGRKMVIAAATIGAIASLAPTLGPTVGGWITDNYSWHWLFFVNLLPGIFVAVVVPILVRVDEPQPSLLRGADYPGMALMAAFLGCLEYTLEEGPRQNWFSDSTIRTTAIIAGVTGVLFIWRSLAYSQPVVDLRALKSRNFSPGCTLSMWSFASITHEWGGHELLLPQACAAWASSSRSRRPSRSLSASSLASGSSSPPGCST
jgi:DHA2 family multidrug resistance protein